MEGIQEYGVIFYQDNIKGSPKFKTEKYIKKNKNIKDIINKNLYRFKFAEFKQSECNVHPYGICKKSLDYAFNKKKGDFCIFLEDDVFLDKNSLYWFNYFYDNNYFKDNIKFVTGESLYFNSPNNNPPSKEKLNNIKKKIFEKELCKYYMILKGSHLTSSIFSTTKEIWNKNTTMYRGQINGETVLNKEIKKNNWEVIFPIVPRAKDIGMLHEDGWSVSWHGKEKVPNKNVFLTSESFETVKEYIEIPRDLKII